MLLQQTKVSQIEEKKSLNNFGLRPYRTNYREITFLVTNVINYVIFENTMAIM